MGNASTRERATSPGDGYPGSSSRRHGRGGEGSSHGHRGLGDGYSSRNSRSRSNFEPTLFGISVGGSRETRERDREAERQAKELRRQEREKERQRERERSLREESVDGGFLVTQGVYTGQEDFKEKIVKQLMIERRLAPFFKGLRDHEDDWSDAQLFAAFHEKPIPDYNAEPPKEVTSPASSPRISSPDNLTVPIASRSRSHSYTSDTSNRSNSSTLSLGLSNCRSRSKTLSISSPKNPVLPSTAGPTQTNDRSRFVDGRSMEAILYQNAIECPICFLYYPPFLNKTRCCDQEICSECFVQIKRADPHVPENHDPPGAASQAETAASIAEQLVSEPAACPFCKQPDFGVTYAPPPFRRGLAYVNQPEPSVPFPASGSNGVSKNESSGSLVAGSNPSSVAASPPLSPSGRRRMMLPFNAPEVVTIDQIRPDWAHKLASARSHAARRAAAATALHTAAFLLGNNERSGNERSGGSSSSYGRRLIRRGGSESPSPNASGSGTPREDSHGPSRILRDRDRDRDDHSVEQRLANLGFISTRESSRSANHNHNSGGSLLNVGGSRADRRSRMVDLEEMMLMEAIRLSLAEEEQRKAREEQVRLEKEDAERKARLIQAEQQSSEAGSAAAHGKGKGPDRPTGTLPSHPSSSSEGSEGVNNDESTFNFRSLAEMITKDEEGGGRDDMQHVEDVGVVRDAGIDKGSVGVDVGRVGEGTS